MIESDDPAGPPAPETPHPPDRRADPEAERDRPVSVERLAASIRGPNAARMEDVRRHLDDLTKPPGSLGTVEDLACKLACILGDPPPALVPRSLLVLAGDHGVTTHGVSAYPPDVTAQMCRNIADGGAAVSVLARLADAEVVVADFGVSAPVEHARVLDRNVVRGTADLSVGPALRADEVERAILEGMRLVREVASGARLIGVGEMGIGNSTAAAGVTAMLLGVPVTRVVGPGTGVGPDGLARKRAALEAALERVPRGASPLRVLSEVGGAELAGLVGVVLEAASAGRPVVLDGFISTAAGLLAARLAPPVTAYLFASHRSAEPGHTLQLEALGLEPILDLGLRLGEGSGAALALPVLDAAAAILREMATFAGAGVSRDTDRGGTSVPHVASSSHPAR